MQFKQETLYVINIAQDIEFLESVHKYKGVKHPSMVCKTDYGIAWANENGCYFYDGQEIRNLLEKGGQKIISDSVWQGHIIDAAAESSMVGYIPKKRQLIVVKDNGDNSNAGNIFLYDMVTQSWSFGDSKMTDSQIKSNFIVFQNELVYMHTDTTNDFVIWDSAPDVSANFSFITKDINFNLPGIRKKVYAVYITYKSWGDTKLQASYRTNGVTTKRHFTVRTNTFDEGGTTLDDFVASDGTSVVLADTSAGMRIASMKPTTPSHANNINSFQLKLEASGTGPEITRVECVADSSDSLNGKYFDIYTAAGKTEIWIDTDNSGTSAPSGSGSYADVIEVTQIGTNDSAERVAVALSSAINEDAGGHTTAEVQGNVVHITDGASAARTDASDGDTGFIVTVEKQGGTASVPSGLEIDNIEIVYKTKGVK